MADTNTNQVHEQVLTEVKSLGDNISAIKENHAEMNKNYEELKSLIDSKSDDSLVQGKIDKLAEDIATRQELQDQKAAEEKASLHERMDNFEVALKRLPSANSGNEDLMKKEAQEFISTAKAIQASEIGIKYGQESKIDVDTYKKYKDAYSKLLRKDKTLLTPEDFKALQVGIDPQGGYTVTPAMSNRIIKKIFEMDPIRQLAAIENTTTSSVEWLVDYDEAAAGWEEETNAGAETATPTINKKKIPVHVLYAKPKASQVLLEDSGININNWLADKVAEKFMRVEGAAFVNGDGVGKPRGFLTYDNGTSFGQIEQVASGLAEAVTADGLKSLKYSMTEYYLNRGTFLMNRTTVREVSKLKDGSGEYLWRPGLEMGIPSLLLGLPVRMSTTMPAIAANALSIVLADFKEAYMIVDRLGISIQRDPYTKKPFVEFYTRKRVGGDVVNFEAIKIQKISA